MINIDKLKKGHVFFLAHITGVLECIMEDDEIQKFGSFSVLVKERDNKLMMVSKENYAYMYYSREEAIEASKSLPSDKIEELLEEDNWLKMLYYVYDTYMSDNYTGVMKEVIEKKTGLKL